MRPWAHHRLFELIFGEARLCAFESPGFSTPEQNKNSADVPVEKPKTSEMADPGNAKEFAESSVSQLNGAIGREVSRLVTEYRQQRAQFDDLSRSGMSPETAIPLRNQLRRLELDLTNRGTPLATLGVDDPTELMQNMQTTVRELLQGTPVVFTHTPGMMRNGSPVKHPYGFFPNNIDPDDGEFLDIFLGSSLDSSTVFIIRQIPQTLQKPDGSPVQVNDPENKCMVGFTTEEDARQAYLSNYPEGWQAGSITSVPVTEFAKLASGVS